MPFVDPDVVLRSDPDRPGVWTLEHDLIYQGERDRFVVPGPARDGERGFETDFATVPGIVTWLVPRDGRHTLPAVLHDWTCVHGIRDGVISPRDADGLFRRSLREAGVPPVRRRLLWAGVRLGAMANPLRRPGMLRDAPAVVGIALLALPVVAPAAVLAVVGYCVYGLVELVAVAVSRKRSR